MKRTTITMDGNGILSIPSNLEDLWMSEGELVDRECKLNCVKLQ